MNKLINSFKSLNKFETGLYLSSVFVVIISFFLSSGQGIFSTITSLIGVTALIFIAKGNVLGQILTVIFSILYGIISIGFRYWGEAITYMGMTAPMAIVAVISWIRNPYEKNKSEVKVNTLKLPEIILMFIYSAVITFVFYYILKVLNANNIVFSTISVTTSFLASYMTFRRSPYYAIGYGANDIVLIVLWSMAAIDDISYIPMIMCFVMFLINDIYGFICWQKMKQRQQN